MTREERIAYLKILKSRITVFDEDDAKQVKALQETIQVLLQEPCEDAISRQAVLDEINRIGVKGFETYNDYSQLYDFVDTLSPVTPQPKTGRWIIIDATHSKCDRCLAIFEIATQNGEANYCPNCGAKMD